MSMSPREITPASAVAHLRPRLLDDLSEAEQLLALHDVTLWLRPEQVVPPPGRWRSLTYVAGRRHGKTFGIAYDLNRGVEAGDITKPGLVAPTEDDLRKVQVAAIIETAVPWFRPEPYKLGVRWPNGVETLTGTANLERPLSGVTTDYVWMTELVKWGNNADAAFNDVTTTCSLGRHPRYLVDTTSSGVNRLILRCIAAHNASPDIHLLRRGTMFGNPHLSPGYLATEVGKYVWGSRRAREELLGEAFTETAGALWEQDWIDRGRRAAAPLAPEQVLLAWDPAMSDSHDADEQGLCKACSKRADGRAEVYVTHDLSGRAKPSDIAKRIVAECKLDAAGVIVETNRGGVMMREAIETYARSEGLAVEVLRHDQVIPRRTPGRIYVKEVKTAHTKETRAHAPAALYQQGRVHHVGTFVQLEAEMVTWEPDSPRSPNRLDACAYVVSELAGVATPVADGRAAVADAASAQAELQRMISDRRGRARGRLGL
jgi:phage terminase large subunit-like protein